MSKLSTITPIILTVLFAATSFADKTETAGGQAIVGGSAGAAYYAPAFTYSLDGTQALLYVQGDHNLADGWADTDSVYLYSNPNTWTGLTSPYTYERTLLPDPSQGLYGGHTLYGGPSVTTADGKYYLVASKSWEAYIFHEQLWGYSTDGRNFTWNQLLNWVADSQGTPRTSAYGIPAVTVVATPSYFWGFLEFYNLNSFGFAVGMIRMHRAANARGYDTVEILSGGTWLQTQNDGTFWFEPDPVWFGVSKIKLLWEGGAFYLWASGAGAHNWSCMVCQKGGSGWADRFVYRAVDPSSTSLTSPVQSVSSNVRCMPGGYDESRVFPMPVSGNGLLYSATNEAHCPAGEAYAGAYIVVTAIQ